MKKATLLPWNFDSYNEFVLFLSKYFHETIWFFTVFLITFLASFWLLSQNFLPIISWLTIWNFLDSSWLLSMFNYHYRGFSTIAMHCGFPFCFLSYSITLSNNQTRWSRGCSINRFVTDWVTKSQFVKISLRCRHTPMVINGVFTHKIKYIIYILYIIYIITIFRRL